MLDHATFYIQGTLVLLLRYGSSTLAKLAKMHESFSEVLLGLLTLAFVKIQKPQHMHKKHVATWLIASLAMSILLH